MKRGILLASLLISCILIATSSAQTGSNCVLDAELINQDPYPAIPGDYVKLVFQLNGISNPNCGTVEFEIMEQFPFSLDPESSSKRTIQSGTYARNYQSSAIFPYQVRVSEEALDGENLIEVIYSTQKSLGIIKEFSINVKDVRADFEISVKDYNKERNQLTFEILNVRKNDVEALVVEIPKQNNIVVKNSNRVIVGTLDANEATTFSFESTPSDGEIIINLFYTDAANIRRELKKSIFFDSDYFVGRIADQKKTSTWIYFLIIVVVLVVALKVNSAIKKKKRERIRKLDLLSQSKTRK